MHQMILLRMSGKNILVLGSIAYDYIMEFSGDFNDNLSSNKEQKVFNIAVMPSSKTVHYGGTSGNISYNLAQINTNVDVITAVGKDFVSLGFQKHLDQYPSLHFKGEIYDDLFTASAYIVNDANHNQIIIFHQGAMVKCPEISLNDKNISKDSVKIASVSPDNYVAMVKWANELHSLNIDFILDPGQVTPAFTGIDLKDLIPKASILIGNEFEINMIMEKLGTDLKGLIELNGNLIITKGDKGSVCYTNGEKTEISCYPIDSVKDTTGAGDGYRAGLLHGLANDWPLVKACKFGAATSSFVVETVGSQTQKYTIEDVEKRLLKIEESK
jgi:adenosine kinase